MDIGYTYGGTHWEHAAIYLPPGIEPPEDFEGIDPDTGRRIQFVRLSDRTLACEKVLIAKQEKKSIYRGCGNFECHRIQLGKCSCGSHSDAEARPQRAEPGEPAWFPPMTTDQARRAAERTLAP